MGSGSSREIARKTKMIKTNISTQKDAFVRFPLLELVILIIGLN